MKKSFVVALALALGTWGLVAGDAKSEVAAAAKKLADQGNYSWKTTVKMPEGARFRAGPTEGKTDKGLSYVISTFGENKMEMVVKGDKGAVLQEGDWKSTAELEGSEGMGRWAGAMARNFQAPAAQAAEIAGWTKDLKKEGDAYTGALTEDGVKNLVSFRRRSGGEPPAVSGATGNAKFWVKDGVLSKYEFFVKGTVTRNNNEMQTERTTTVEIQNVGTTKVDAPEAATKKLS